MFSASIAFGSAAMRRPQRNADGVHRHRFAVERDRALDRFRRQRQRADLIGVAEHHHVGGDRLAGDRIGDARRVEEVVVLVAGGGRDRALEPLGRQRIVGIAGEVAGQHLGDVDDHPGAAGRHRGQHLLVAGDHDVAAEHQVGGARGDADGVDVLRALGDAHMALHRAALLREAGHVEHADALAFEMRRHADQRADGDHAGAADAGDDDVVGEAHRRPRHRRLGQRRHVLRQLRLRRLLRHARR